MLGKLSRSDEGGRPKRVGNKDFPRQDRIQITAGAIHDGKKSKPRCLAAWLADLGLVQAQIEAPLSA